MTVLVGQSRTPMMTVLVTSDQGCCGHGFSQNNSTFGEGGTISNITFIFISYLSFFCQWYTIDLVSSPSLLRKISSKLNILYTQTDIAFIKGGSDSQLQRHIYYVLFSYFTNCKSILLLLWFSTSLIPAGKCGLPYLGWLALEMPTGPVSLYLWFSLVFLV